MRHYTLTCTSFLLVGMFSSEFYTKLNCGELDVTDVSKAKLSIKNSHAIGL